MDATNSLPKKYVNYECEKCVFLTSNKKDYKRHLLTEKHNRPEILTTNTQPTPKIEKIGNVCKCGNSYKHASNLCRHKRTCDYKENNDDLNEKIELIKILENIKQNTLSELDSTTEPKYKIQNLNYLKMYDGDKIIYVINPL
jgi:hypothetical protein